MASIVVSLYRTMGQRTPQSVTSGGDPPATCGQLPTKRTVAFFGALAGVIVSTRGVVSAAVHWRTQELGVDAGR
eukprot:1216380-Prymnesium_polylepis.2